MNNSTLEGLLGMIVFGPNTDTPAGVQWTADRLRQAATLLEYRYAIERRHDAQLGTQLGEQNARDATQQAPAAPPRKRNRGRPAKASNGAAHDAPTPPAGEPLFQTVGGTPVPAP